MRPSRTTLPLSALCGFSLLILLVIGTMSGRPGSAQSAIKVAPGVSLTVAATGLGGPRGLLFAPSGDLYVAEQTSGDIARIAPDGRVTRVAKGLSDPHDLALDTKGNVYVAETGTNRVARISPAGAVTTYIAGLAAPVDLDFNPQGELLVCELGSGKVVAFKSPKSKRVVASGLKGPHGLAFKSGFTYINEWTGNRIVKLNPQGRVESVAQLEVPVGLAFGKSGDLYVSQPQVGKVARIKPDGTLITLIEGAQLPHDPAFDAAGNLYIGETGTGRILKLTGDF